MVKTFRPACFADWHNCPIMKVLPLLLDMEARNGEHQITPSNFMREMLLSTEQRYERLIQPVRKTTCISANLKCFKVMPDIIVFQNFVRGGVYSVQLTVMNIQEASKSLRVDMEQSNYFSIKYADDTTGSRLAPGLKFCLEVRFSTDILQDYKHKITFITTDETFEIPIVAIGPRPLLDLPDRIVLPRTAIKVSTERSIMVKNIGDVWASFVLEASRGFEVERNREVLKSDECCKVTVFFHPEKVGLVEGELKLTYETGEILFVKLEGTAEEADLNFSIQKVNFIDCYLGLSEERVVTLKNSSDFVVNYRWISHDCAACKSRVRSAIKERFEDLMDYELVRDNALEYQEIVDDEMNKEIYERILREQKKECDMSLEPVFAHPSFTIEPKCGQLWPKTKVNFSVIYAPKDVDLHKTIAYLDVAGRKKAYPLDMFGTCEGPRIHINLEELDAQDIYIGSVHRYEVAFYNPGPIPGAVQYVNMESKFGGEFKCSENLFAIEPDESKTVYIEFTSLTRGKFSETVKFKIMQSSDILSFIMRGTIVCPLLNFDITVLDFGHISVGEIKKQKFNLENNTQVSIDYQTEIVVNSQKSQYMLSEDCSEFSCSSTEGAVQPYTKVPYFVQVQPNAAIDKMAELVITMWEAPQPSRTVYICYKAHVPSIQCLTPNISIKSMFITQKYCRTLTIENKSDYMGNLSLSSYDDEGNLQIQLEQTQVFIKPWDTHDFRLEIKTDVIGDMCAKIMGLFYGASTPFVITEIVVLSRGPCIDSDLVDTNIGKMNTLTSIKKSFMLSNDSPIPASVHINIIGPYITPAEAVINLAPEETVESNLIIYGTCGGRFKTSIKLEIDGAEPDCVVYSGEFVGGSISTVPPLEPFYNIGTITTMTNFTQEINYLNEGKVGQAISFKEYNTTVEYLTMPAVDNGRPFFMLSTNQFVVQAGKHQSLFIDCFAKSSCRVSTRFVCSSKKQSKRNQITKKLFDFNLLATFEVPHVTLSKPYMEFRIDIGTAHTVAVLEDSVSLINQSRVILYMDILMDEPFYFVSSDGVYKRQEVELEPGEELSLLLTFKPDLREKRVQTKKGAMKIQYLRNPTVDKLALFGIVNYPNIDFEPSYVDFECIPIGHTGQKIITLRNISPLEAEYSFEMSLDYLVITPIEFQPKEVQNETRATSYDSLLDYMLADEEYLNQLAKDDIVGENDQLEGVGDQNPKDEDYEEEDGDVGENEVLEIKSQSSSLILGPEDCLEVAKLTLADSDLREDLRPILYPILEDSKDNIISIDEKLVEILHVDVIDNSMQNIIDLVPRSGLLTAHGHQIISVSVNPPPDTELSATIVCNVAGGITTELDISAKSTPILYNIKSDVIDFGVVGFNQIAKTTFQIENIGYAKFQYSMRYDTVFSTFSAEPGWIEMEPADGTIAKDAMMEVVVKYFPGYPGYFETYAYLEIAFFDSIKLTIKGCAVFPQFYFDFPRLLDDELNILSYYAIADITHPFHSQCHEDFTSLIEPDYNDWEVVRYKRHYPSVRDIVMAIERKIVQNHLIANPDLVTYKYANPNAIIPDLTLPPYIIDLGYVIRNSERIVLITPLKYAAATMKLFWLRVPRKGVESGFNMLFQKDQPGPFLVFKPTAKMFPEDNTQTVGHLSCVINATIKIDFEVKAIVTVPSLVFKENFVLFGNVQCGFALKKSVYLENNGAVTCSYKILIQSSAERPSNIFFTKAREGVVDAGQFAKIDIYFQPQSNSKYEWRLIVLIEGNKPLKIALRGYGFLPKLEIIDNKIYFEPSLPYSKTNVKYVKIINRSQFPAEICFTDCDKELYQEAAIVKTLLNYYNVKKLFIPPRQVGAPLPEVLIDIYTFIIDHLRSIIKNKVRNEYLSLKKKLVPEEPRSASTMWSGSSQFVDNPEISDPLEDKNLVDIQALIMENILELRSKEYSRTNIPRKGSVFEFDCDVPVDDDSKDMKEGVLLIFHGSSLTDYIFAANKASHMLQINVKSIDDLVYESLVRNEIFAANKVNQMIEDSFGKIASQTDFYIPYDYDSFDILKSRVDLIHSGKTKPQLDKNSSEKLKHGKEEKHPKGKKHDDDSKSKSPKHTDGKSGSPNSAKSTKGEKKSENTETFLRLPIDIFYEILADSISKYPAGLVVESLNSTFITKPKSALIGLLKGAGNIRYIQGIYLAVSIDNFRASKLEDNNTLGECSDNEAINEIMEMDQEEFDELDPKAMELFKEVYLKRRKMDTERRLTERELRLTGYKSKLGLEHLKLPSKDNLPAKPRKSVINDNKSTKSKDSKKISKKQDKKKKEPVEEVQRVSEQSRMIEDSLHQAEMEAFEIRFIFEHWHRPDKELTTPVPTKLPTVKEPKATKQARQPKETKRKKSADTTMSGTTGTSDVSPKSKQTRKPEANKRQKTVIDLEVEDEDPVEKRKTITFLTTSELQCRADVGIPMWYICNAHTESKTPYSQLIAEYLCEDKEVLQAIRLARLAMFGERTSPEQLYTVLSEPKRERGVLSSTNQFALYDCPTTHIDAVARPSSTTIIDGSTTKLSTKNKSLKGKGGSLRRSSTSILSSKKSRKKGNKDVLVSSAKSLIPRRIMQPDDEITLEVNFFPDACGVFTHYYDIEIVTLPIPFRIYLEGKADVPRIYMNPSMLFSKVLPEIAGHELGVAYFEREEMFHMGAAVVQPADARNECLIVEDKLNLINESFLPCEMAIGFLEATSDFTVDASQLVIASNNSQFLTVRGHPVHAGNINACLVLTNTNNPRVNCIKLSELGTKFMIEITPRDVFFKRVLLDHIVQIDVQLKNTSHVGTCWDIDFKHAEDIFGLSETSGYIKPLGVNVLTFSYEATEFKVVPVQEIVIKFYDKNRHCDEPILQEILKLSAEVVEVGLEFDTDVELDDNKIGQLFTFVYTIKNKSKFELNATFYPLEDKENNEDMAVIRKNTSINVEDVQMKPNDVTKLPINFKINVPIEFKAVPIYNVVISDPLVGREVISFILRVTGKVFSSTYKLCPGEDIIFSPQLVDTEVKKDIVLYNNGKYSFTYLILDNSVEEKRKRSLLAVKEKKEKRFSKSSEKGSGKSAKSKKSKKSKASKASKLSLQSSKKSGKNTKKSPSVLGKKTKPTVLKQGIFTISPTTGTVQPHTEAYIQITCKTKKVGSYLEKVLFVISGVTGKYSNGHPLTLQGTACLPEIDFDNLDYIFKEYLIIDSQEDSLCCNQMTSSSLFVMADKHFYFKSTCILLQTEAHLRIRNAGEIGANVSVTITGDSSVFSVTPEILRLEAYTSAYFTICFKPLGLEQYKGGVHFSVEQSTSKLDIGLYGEGQLPVIEIVSPTISSAVNIYELDFKQVLLESKVRKSVVMRNPGPLDAKVVLGVIDDPSRNIILEPVNCQTFQDVSNLSRVLENVFNSTTVVSVKPEETVEVEVVFTPDSEAKIDTFIKIFITNNPYDCIKIHINGQGYKEDVIIEQLESFMSPDVAGKSQSIVQNESNYQFTLISYNLDFGYNAINTLNKKFIKLKNLSTKDTYRFVFTPQDNLNYIPCIGHLTPNSSKDIIVTFFCQEPISFENKLQICKLTKIQLAKPDLEDIAWDERQQLTIWVPEDTSGNSLEKLEESQGHYSISKSNANVSQESVSSKIISRKEEPEYTEISESVLAIRCLFNIVVDYCNYKISDTKIEFPSTTMFQSSVIDIVVENISRVPVAVDWSIHHSANPRKSMAPFMFSAILDDSSGQSNIVRPQSCYGKQPQPLTGNERFLKLSRPGSFSSRSSIFSSSFSSGPSSLKSYCDSDPIPLIITPAKMCIAPLSSFTFSFKFSPYTPLDYVFQVSSEVPNLQPGVQPILLNAIASSILPLYHFRIEQSDYLTARRGCRENCEIQVGEDTKVLEFYAIGFGIPVKNQFVIINPTGEPFSYRWEKCHKERNIARFQCDHPEGTVLKGRTVEASFTFIAEKSGTFETFYNFTIENYNLRVMFLLVGHARLPCVFFVGSGKELKPTVMGIDVHDTVILKNTEDISMRYKINNASLYNEGRAHKISIEPTNGFLQAKSETTIKILFRPTKIGRFSFNVEFVVERLKKPVVLAVSATCYDIEPSLKHIKEYSITDLVIDSENIIHLPVLVPKNPEMCTFLLGNLSKVGFYYKWELGDPFVEDFVTLEMVPKEGYVKTSCEVQTLVYVKAVKFLAKKYIKLLLKISYGPTIPITLVCSTCKTRLKLSDTIHDFGACLAQKHDTLNNEWTLELKNNDYINYMVQMEPINYDHLTILKKEAVIIPKQTIKIQFYFHPKEVTKYDTKIILIINEKKVAITILGEGVSMEVGLLNTCDKFLNFGGVPLGKYVKRRVSIVNKTKCLVSIYFELYNRLPMFVKTTRQLEPDFEHLEVKPSDVVIKKKKTNEKKDKKEKGARKSDASRESKESKNTKKSKKSEENKDTKITKKEKKEKPGKKEKNEKDEKNEKNENTEKKEKIEKTEKKVKKEIRKSIQPILSGPIETPEEKQTRLINESVRIRPLKWIKLHPENSVEFTITYMPTDRMPVFQEQIYCQVEDTVIPLCVIKGSCIAPQYSLHRDYIAFGTVIIGSSIKYYTKLINSGDVGGRFKWSWKSARNDVFSIEPMEGYSSPGTSTNFEVNFQPSYVQCNCISCAKLTIDNYKTTFDLDLCGTCINLPNPKETLKFAGPVRETYTKKLTLKNSTPERWVIKPSISGDFYHVNDLIIVEAKSSSTVEVTYKPLTMTQENKYHEGSIFLPLPEGQGMLYELLGESHRPKITKVIEQTVPSKTYNVIPVDVFNWLQTTQQFTVISQINQPDGPKKVLYKLTGSTILEVPSYSTKQYQWIIYTLNEGKLNFEVKFRNEETKEYIGYEIKLTVVKCQVLDKIVLNACARGAAEYKMRLENPLGEPTTYKLSSHCGDLYFVKEATVAPYTEVEIWIEYKPLYPKAEFTTVFEAISPQLGTFPYNFILSAHNAEMEKTITITAHLGQKNEHNAYVYNPSKSNVEFTATLDSLEFTVEKIVAVKPNEKAVIEIAFEPSDLGGVHSKLTLSSPILGLYIFPLYGIGLPPKALGPFPVKPNFQTFIPFKNPFAIGVTFAYALAGTDFILKTSSEFVKPRSIARINISCDRRDNSTEEPSSILTGKLSIRCAEEGYSRIEWVIYLKSSNK